MKAKQLIDLLRKLDPEKTVMIQQGGEHDYMTAHEVKELTVYDEDGDGDSSEDETGARNIIAIEFK
jgi:hypothetical protein